MTPQQKKLLDFIGARQSETGVSPSYDEMQAHMGLRSKSGIHRLVNELEAHGKIKRLFGRARSIEVIRHIVCPNCGETITSTGEQVSQRATAA